MRKKFYNATLSHTVLKESERDQSLRVHLVESKFDLLVVHNFDHNFMNLGDKVKVIDFNSNK